MDFVQILLESCLIILGLYLAFFKSYFQERGKIVATKKDLEEITAKVEKVKSEIEILTHQKINLSTEKQNSLLEFTNKYAAWLNYINHVGLVGDVDNADIYFEKTNEKLDQLFYGYLIAESKIDIFFIEDKELISLKDAIKLKTIELLNELSLALISARAEQTKISITQKLPNQIPDNSYKTQKLEKFYRQRHELIKEYL